MLQKIFLAETSEIRTITITLISLQLLLGSLFIAPVRANELSNTNNMNTVAPTNESTKIRTFGMWAPYQLPL
ncbi:MAG: hypothetical protein WBL88_05430, partial [Nitrososphaeraceae archaeon]